MVGLLKWFRSRLSRRAEPPLPDLVYVLLPGRIEPMQRGEQFEDPLMPDLQRLRLGVISGGGSQLGPENELGQSFCVSAGIDIDTFKVDETRALLRERLPALGCPEGTEIHYSQGEIRLQDEYVEGSWRLAQPRERLHPGFGI